MCQCDGIRINITIDEFLFDENRPVRDSRNIRFDLREKFPEVVPSIKVLRGRGTRKTANSVGFFNNMAAIIFLEDKNSVFRTFGFCLRLLQEISFIDSIQEFAFILRPLC